MVVVVVARVAAKEATVGVWGKVEAENVVVTVGLVTVIYYQIDYQENFIFLT